MLYLMFSRGFCWKNLKLSLNIKEDYILVARKWLVKFDSVSWKQRLFQMVVDRIFARSLFIEAEILRKNKEDLVVVFARMLLIEFDGISQKQRCFLLLFAWWLLINFDGITWKQRTDTYVLAVFDEATWSLHMLFSRLWSRKIWI